MNARKPTAKEFALTEASPVPILDADLEEALWEMQEEAMQDLARSQYAHTRRNLTADTFSDYE